MELKQKLVDRIKRKKWKFISDGLFYHNKFVVDFDDVVGIIDKTFEENKRGG